MPIRFECGGASCELRKHQPANRFQSFGSMSSDAGPPLFRRIQLFVIDIFRHIPGPVLILVPKESRVNLEQSVCLSIDEARSDIPQFKPIPL